MSTDLKLLREQYDAAVVDEQWIEALCLAGYLVRHNPQDPRVQQAREREIPPKDLHYAMQQAYDGVVFCDEEQHPSESWDALSRADELLAGLTLVQPQLADDLSRDLVALLHAFPEPFAEHSETASLVLQQEALEPTARRLWAAVEIARFEQLPDDEGASTALLTLAGLEPQIALPAMRLVAGDAPPLPPEWVVLGRGPDWTLTLTQDETGAPVLCVDGSTGHFECDEQTVATNSSSVSAMAGAWRVVVCEQELHFTLC